MATIYRVIQIKLNQFKKMPIWSLTYQQSVFKRYHSDKHFLGFLPTRWRQKSTGIDMEQNYVTGTHLYLFLPFCRQQYSVMSSHLSNDISKSHPKHPIFGI